MDKVATTIQQYYLEKKEIRLMYPDSPIVHVKRGVGRFARSLYFPMEMLQLAENQRVATHMQTSEMVSKLIRAAAIPPARADEQIAR